MKEKKRVDRFEPDQPDGVAVDENAEVDSVEYKKDDSSDSLAMDGHIGGCGVRVE